VGIAGKQIGSDVPITAKRLGYRPEMSPNFKRAARIKGWSRPTATDNSATIGLFPMVTLMLAAARRFIVDAERIAERVEQGNRAVGPCVT